jgi:hypothetical protein
LASLEDGENIFSEMLVSIKFTWHHNPEHQLLNHCDNLKFHKLITLFKPHKLYDDMLNDTVIAGKNEKEI